MGHVTAEHPQQTHGLGQIRNAGGFSQGHGAFLHRAAHDSQFRAALEADPQAALAEYGPSAVHRLTFRSVLPRRSVPPRGAGAGERRIVRRRSLFRDNGAG